MSQRKFVFSQVMEFFPRWVLENVFKWIKGNLTIKSIIVALQR